jgi:hypothetical protein
MCLTLFRTSLSDKPPSCITGSSSRLVYSRTRLCQLMFAASERLIFKVPLPSVTETVWVKAGPADSRARQNAVIDRVHMGERR